MALGNYVKTTFVEGSPPGISAARLNNHENKTAELDIEANSKNTQLLEATGYGVISGLTVTAQATPNMTVNVATGTVHMANGVRFTPAANSALAVTAADATNPRIDIVYVSSAGIISYLAGTPAPSPAAPATPTDGFLLAQISVGAAVTTITNANITDQRKMKNTTDSVETGLASHLADDVHHVPYAVDTGVANTYAVTLSPAPTAYVDGMAVAVKIANASTGVSTINVNALGAKPILDSLGNAITAGGLKAGIIYSMRYNATTGNFIVQGKGGGGNATAGDLLSGKTATVDTGPITGTLALTGTATTGDVLPGKTFYNTDPKTQLIGTYSNIKSIQRGSVSLTAASQTVTIAAVDTTKAIVRITYFNSAGQQARGDLIQATLTNATTITLALNYYSVAITVEWEVIEFNNVKSLQTGVLSGNAPPQTVTIASINPLKSMLFFSFNTNSSSSNDVAYCKLNMYISGATSLYCNYANVTGEVKLIAWQVVEFN